MASFTFTSPNGKSYTVNGPDGATQEQAFQVLQKQMDAAQAPNQAKLASIVKDAQTPSAMDALAGGVGGALTDTGRAIKQLVSTTMGGPGAGIAATAENEALDQQEAPALEALKTTHPRLYYGTYAPTSVLSMAPGGEGVGMAARLGTDALPAATSLLGRAAAWAAPKAAQGAAYGAQTPGDTPTNIAAGAALGPAADLAGAGLGKLASAGAKAASGVGDFGAKLFQPDASAQRTVQKIIGASRIGADETPAPAIPGASFTQGGDTLNPGIQSLEQAVRQRVAGNMPNEAVFQSQQRANNDAIHSAINGVEDATVTPDKTSAAAQTALQGARDTLSENESKLWQQIPMSTKVDAANTASAVDSYINKQSVTNQRIIQRSAGDFLDDFKATVSKYADEADGETQVKMPFGEVKDLRSTLGQSIRDAQKSGNSNAVRLLKGLDEKLLGSLGDENALLGVPEPTGNATLDSALVKSSKMDGTVTGQQLGDAYNAARGFTADIHNNYFPRDVQGLLDKDPSKVLDAATSTPDKLDAFLNAASQAPDKGAAATKAVRQYLLNKALSGASMSARGGTKAFINGQTLGKYLTENQAALSKVFSADEMNTLDAAAKGAYRNIATEAASPRLGSTTINNLFKNQNVTTQMIPSVPGQNAVVAKAAASGINKLLGRYSNATELKLRDALLDPSANAKLFQAPASGPSLIDLLKTGAGKLPLPVRTIGKATTDPKAALIRYLLQASPQQ